MMWFSRKKNFVPAIQWKRLQEKPERRTAFLANSFVSLGVRQFFTNTLSCFLHPCLRSFSESCLATYGLLLPQSACILDEKEKKLKCTLSCYVLRKLRNEREEESIM